MACEVCQHCQEAVLDDEPFAVHDRFSYHQKCNKCYVCNETNLQNAELFKGVIFCSSCSQRIFQGCSTARRNKSGHRNKRSLPMTRHKRKERSRMKERRPNRSRAPIPPGVIELARMAASTDSEYISDSKNHKKESKPRVTTTEVALEVRKNIFEAISYKNFKDLKKGSAETGMTTEVTEQLLRQMNCPVVENRKNEVKTLSPMNMHLKHRAKHLVRRMKNKRNISDMRIAELGASTEIANMPLRKHSEAPVLIKSTENINTTLRKHLGVPALKSRNHVEQLKDDDSLDLSALIQRSETSGDCDKEWLESSSSAKESARKFWPDRRLCSLLVMPYKCFKRNIINRSSLITVVKRRKNRRTMFLKGLKIMLKESTTGHQDRGLRRLYSTINRRKVPYKMGWLNLMVKVSRNMSRPQEHRSTSEKFPQEISRQRQPKHCKHFTRSHSYRCMRSQVMKRAGPTKSELAVYRNKIKGVFAPSFLKNLLNYSKYSSMKSEACGSEPVSTKY